MPSAFFGIEMGRRALAASQRALDVIGHNTSNVNTPGYSRQVVVLQTTDPYTLPSRVKDNLGQVGTGVDVASINRIRDAFIDRRVQDGISQQGALGSLGDILSRVEQAFNEPGDAGLGGLITGFFNSFGDLSANPESGAIRSTVRNKAEAVVNAFQSLDTSLRQLNPEITQRIGVKIKDANDIALQVAELNGQIRASLAAGDQPNDLLDKRGALLDTLSGLVDIQLTNVTNPDTGKTTGEVNVNVGGFPLVQGKSTNALPSTVTTINGSLGLLTATGDTIPLRSGEVFGLVKATTLIQGYRNDLDTLASTLITQVNTVHASGYGLDGSTNTNFFVGTSAASIGINAPIKTNLDSIAAAAAPVPPNTFARGNGDNARALGRLAYAPVIGSSSLNDFYAAKVALIGADSRSVITESANQDKILSQLKSQQSSISGVSLDEELTNMLQYQRTYQAAARIVTAMDDFLDRIINGLVK